MDALLLSRIQFAWLIAFHILLPAFTVDLACYIATHIVAGFGRVPQWQSARIRRFHAAVPFYGRLN